MSSSVNGGPTAVRPTSLKSKPGVSVHSLSVGLALFTTLQIVARQNTVQLMTAGTVLVTNPTPPRQ
jgi:hypothetical protein